MNSDAQSLMHENNSPVASKSLKPDETAVHVSTLVDIASSATSLESHDELCLAKADIARLKEIISELEKRDMTNHILISEGLVYFISFILKY